MKPTKTFIGSPVLRGFVSLAALLAATLPLGAQTLYWQPASGTWSTASTSLNWSTTSGGPGSTTWTDNSSAVIENTNPSITIGQSGALTNNATSLTVQNGVTFIGGGTAARRLNVAGGITGNFTLNITATGGGGVTANGAANYNGTATIQSGSFIMDNTAAGGTNSHINLTGGSFGLGSTIAGNSLTIGSLSGSAGTVSPNIGGSVGTRTLIIDQATNTTFSGVLNAGTSSRVLAVTKSGAGSLTLNGTNLHEGQTLISAGSLIINGNNAGATGAVTVAAGATLGGSGTIGGATTINGIHSPGTSPGIQTFTNGLTYNTNASVVWELIANGLGTRGTDFDGVNVTGGTLNFAGPTTLNLTFNLTNSVVDWSNAFWANEYTGTNGWLVYNAASAISGFDNLALSATNTWLDSQGSLLTAVRPASSFTLYHDTLNNDIYLNLVPEPSTYALLVVAAAGLGAHVIRRRRK